MTVGGLKGATAMPSQRGDYRHDLMAEDVGVA